MSAALLSIRLVLAGVFLVAGVAKLADRAGSIGALRGFGVPKNVAGVFGVLLPLLELIVVVLLLVSAAAWWGAVGSLGLLLVFCAGMVGALVAGVQPDCHCFGQVHSARVGWGTLARTGVLAGLAGFVVIAGSHNSGVSASRWVTTVTPAAGGLIVASVLASGLAAFLGWFCLQVVRQNGRILERLEEIAARADKTAGASALAPASVNGHPPVQEPAAGNGHATGNGFGARPGRGALGLGEPLRAGLAVGSRAPSFELPDLDHRSVALEQLVARGLPVLLVFSDPGCGPCAALAPELAAVQREHHGRLTLAVVSRGSAARNRANSAGHQLERVLLQRDREVAEAYRCHGTPGAVVVAPDATIASGLAQGADQIRTLVAQTADPLAVVQAAANGNPDRNGHTNGNGNGSASAHAAAYSLLGRPAPTVTLPDLDGNLFVLAETRGNQAVLVFWNPGCGFCQRMVPDLKAWEVSPPADAPDLVLIASGGPEPNRAMGLRTTVLLDPDGATQRAFAVGGTPMGVLIDREGRVASELARGAAAVFDLARSAGAGAVISPAL